MNVVIIVWCKPHVKKSCGNFLICIKPKVKFLIERCDPRIFRQPSSFYVYELYNSNDSEDHFVAFASLLRISTELISPNRAETELGDKEGKRIPSETFAFN